MYSLHLTHPKWTHTRSVGSHVTTTAPGEQLGVSVPCSRTPQSWYWRRILPPPTIPAGPEIRTHNLPLTSLTSLTRYPLGPRLPRLKSSVKFPQSVMIWAAMSSAGVGPLCFLKSTVNAAIYQEILEHFMLPSADKLMEMLISFSSRTWHLPTLPKVPKSWFNDHGVTVLDWPANWPDLNPIENIWGIVKRKMRDTRPNNADELKATVKETWAFHTTSAVPQTDHLHATPNWGSN